MSVYIETIGTNLWDLANTSCGGRNDMQIYHYGRVSQMSHSCNIVSHRMRDVCCPSLMCLYWKGAFSVASCWAFASRGNLLFRNLRRRSCDSQLLIERERSSQYDPTVRIVFKVGRVHNEVRGCHSLTLLDRALIFNWFVVAWESFKKKPNHHKGTCIIEIGLGLHSLLTTPHFIVSTLEVPYSQF